MARYYCGLVSLTRFDLVAAGSMCAGAPWPTFASVYDDFNVEIVAKVPFQPFWAPPK